ncbi:Bet v1-like protein [Lichtheimia hyalospora FSU 10163]|nr:Bet v1-like protein [Lichtheimia hyalospora FSU 10163]
MVVIESNNRHAATSRKALDYLKELSNTLDGWNFSQEKDGVKLYIKPESNGLNIVRGDAILKTDKYTPREVATVATNPGCRKIWDEKYEVSEVKEMFTHLESLFWVKLKAPWPVSPRDFVGIALRDFDEDVCYVSMSSVEDPVAPPVSGCVRGTLLISGWKVYKTEGGIGITYITQVDMAGSIPSSFLKNIQLQVPLCAGKVVDYARSYGFPPVTVEAANVVYKSEDFNHAKREFTANVEGSDGVCRWLVSSQMYPNGVKVSVPHEIVDADNNNKVVVVKIDGPTTVKISKA